MTTQAFQAKCRALRPILGSKIDALWTAYLFQDEDGRQEMDEHLTLLANANLHADVQDTMPIFHPPSAAQANGDIVIGSVHYNNQDVCPFGLKRLEMAQHVSLVGRTGSGKSNAAYLLAAQLTKANIPWLCLDWKQSWRRLILMPQISGLKVYTVGRPTAPLRVNPLVPPKGTDPKTWIKFVVECIMHAYFCGEGVAYLLTTVIDELYEQRGVYKGEVTRYPTFRDVMVRLQSVPAVGRVGLWLSSATRAVHSMCFGAMDDILNHPGAIDMDDLLSHPTVIELEALGHADKVFFSELLMLEIYVHRLAKNDRNKLNHVLIIEEAHHLLSRMTQKSGQPAPIVEVIFREIRELSQGIVFLDQMPSEISRTALANTYTTIAMGLKGKQDVATISAAMLLDDNQPMALGMMEIGKAVVKLQGRIREPFMIRIPRMDIPDTQVTDDDVTNLMAPYLRVTEQLEIAPAIQLSDSESRLLQDIAIAPDSGTVARYTRLGLSGRQGDKAKRGLIDAGLVVEQEQLTRRGRMKTATLTEAGRNYLQNMLDEEK